MNSYSGFVNDWEETLQVGNSNDGFSFVFPSPANTEYHPHTLSVSVPYVSYICPEGANITMVCEQSGALEHKDDRIATLWFFNSHMDQRCRDHLQKTDFVKFNSQKTSFTLTLLGVTRANQGRYCCMLLDFLLEGKHKPVQEAHSHMMLTVTARKKPSQFTANRYTLLLKPSV